MWRLFFETRHRRLHDIFMNASLNEAREALANPAESDLFYGFEVLFAEFTKKIKKNPTARQSYFQVCLDELLRCAEAFGVLRLDDPQALLWGNSELTADQVISRMEVMLGIRINFPNPYPNEFGLATNRGIAGYRTVHALDLALRVRDLVEGVENPKILEIGAGLGRSAYYALQFGLPGYSIVDVPFTAISQGYFLMTALGPDRVTVAGEAADRKEGVRLMTPDDFLNSADRYDLVVNMDSFTEVGTAVAEKYWQKIENSSARFLSINHETNPFTVKELYEKSRRVRRVSRHPCWIKRGYVEELIEFA